MLDQKELHSPGMKDELLHGLQIPGQSLLQGAIEIRISAIIVVVSEEKTPRLIWLALLPTLMFFVLDVYYLSLERGFRSSYSEFVKKLHNNSLRLEDLFLFDSGDVGSQVVKAISSFSVWPFYGLLTGGIILVSFLVDPR